MIILLPFILSNCVRFDFNIPLCHPYLLSIRLSSLSLLFSLALLTLSLFNPFSISLSPYHYFLLLLTLSFSLSISLSSWCFSQGTIQQITVLLAATVTNWSNIQHLFKTSPEIRRELPLETTLFSEADTQLKSILHVRTWFFMCRN